MSNEIRNEAERPNIVKLDIAYLGADCARGKMCEEQFRIFQERHRDRYIGGGSVKPDQIVAAVLDVGKLSSEEFVSKMKSLSKGAAYRQIKKAVRAGYYCKPFPYSLFVPDIYNINTSMPVRTGRPMSSQYQLSIEELGGAPEKYIELEKPHCHLHYDYWWGVFRKSPGYKQGAVTVDEQLVGYIMLRRNGNYAFYGKILGHGDFLQHGVMHLLHSSIVEWVLSSKERESLGLHYLIYAGYFQGMEGLQSWKRKALFEPALLVVDESESRN